MQIALLTDGIYPYVLGGMQKHSYYLAKYLAQSGVSVDLYHTGRKEANTNQLHGFSENELAYITPYYVPFPSIGKLPGHYVLESYLYSEKIYNLLRQQEEVNFIYAQGFAGWKTITEKKKDKSLPPIAVNFHGVEMFQQAPNLNVKLQHHLLRPPIKYILRNSDFVFSLGGKLTAIQQRITTKPILETPIGIEESWLLPEASNVTCIRSFVFIGRYERRKGVEELNHALAQLQGKHEFNFSFIGPIPTTKQINQPNITYFGLVKEEEKIKAILATADVLVCPSYSEGMPTVILEAMASGLAVIATDVGAVSNLVNDNNGWLIQAGNKEALQQALIDAVSLSDTKLSQKKAASLRLIKDSYTWEAVIKTTLKDVENIVVKARI